MNNYLSSFALFTLCLSLIFSCITKFTLTQACFNTSDEIGSHGLQINGYQSSCPEAESIIFSWVEKAVADEPRMAASLLRLHFHDCFVNGCDASVLLDDTPFFTGEKTAGPNLNSLRGFEVIDAIKCDLETICPETVSCADILATVARDSVVLSGGPSWEVEMGRRDSLTASKTDANNNLPGPNSDLQTLITKFQNIGLDTNDMVALSGGHTIGKARCSTFTSRLKSDSNSGDIILDLDFQASLQQLCSTNTNTTLTELDLVTPGTFDNQYYINLISGEALLPSDQALVTENSPTLEIVENYAVNAPLFFEDFKKSMMKMGSSKPLTGKNGEIRRSCRIVN